MKNSRAQVSTELLMIIGLMLLLLVPLLYYSFNRSNIVREDISVQKAEFAAERLARLADSVGYLGGGSSMIDEIEVPPNVKSVGIDTVNFHDVVFTIDSSTGEKQIVKSSAFRIKDDVARGIASIKRPGNYWIKVSALPLDDPDGAQVEMELQ